MIKRRKCITSLLSLLVVVLGIAGFFDPSALRANAQADAPDDAPAVRFEPVRVYVDPQGKPLAAYQFELTARRGVIRIVGVENGDHKAFADAPYYDRPAIEQGQSDRIIVAAFNTAPTAQLPSAKVRVATLHIEVIGNVEPAYQVKLQAAADADGHAIQAIISHERGAQ